MFKRRVKIEWTELLARKSVSSFYSAAAGATCRHVH